MAQVLSLTASASVPYGSRQGNVLQPQETTALGPSVVEQKYYAPGFTFDVTITRAVQTFNVPWFATLMHILSWIGFSPQAGVISVLFLLFLYVSGLKWETIICGISLILAYTLLKHSWVRTFLLVIFGGMVALIGLSRIYQGQHWASDVIAAYLLGSVWLSLSILVYRWGKPRFFANQPVAPETISRSQS